MRDSWTKHVAKLWLFGSLLLLIGCKLNQAPGVSISLQNLPQEVQPGDPMVFDLVIENNSQSSVHCDVGPVVLEDTLFVRAVSVNPTFLSAAMKPEGVQGFPSAPEERYVSLAPDEKVVIPISSDFYEWNGIFGNNSVQAGPIVVQAGLWLEVCQPTMGRSQIVQLRSPHYQMIMKSND